MFCISLFCAVTTRSLGAGSLYTKLGAGTGPPPASRDLKDGGQSCFFLFNRESTIQSVSWEDVLEH